MTADIHLCPFEDNPDPGEMTVRADPELLAKGWIRRNVVDPERVEELVALYQELGFETLIRSPTPEAFGPHCESCAEEACSRYFMIYTRLPGNTPCKDEKDKSEFVTGHQGKGNDHGPNSMSP